jgi:DNA-binding CsgD family transcriptional regulator
VESIELAGPILGGSFGVMLLAHRGRVRIAAGALESGVLDLLDADRRMVAAGWVLSVQTDWVPSAAFAMRELGWTAQARELVDRELAGAIPFGGPRRHGLALSLSGVLDPTAAGLARLHEAVEILDATPARLEQARARVNLGEGLRLRGQRAEARMALTEALEIAHACGGGALVQRARAELVASGARPRRSALRGPDALTPAELRTARMAAGGLSNREIAQSLFVSSKTVESHLSHAYWKLSISGRRELADALE